MTRMAVVSGGPDLACPQPQGGPDRQLDREQKKTSDQRPGGILFCYPSDMHEWLIDVGESQPMDISA